MIATTHWRRAGGDAEPLAAPGQTMSFATGFTASQQYWGKTTSRNPDPGTKAALDLLAFRLGVKPATLAKAIAMGVVNG